MASTDDDLPKNWIRKESRSKPGRFYYANKLTGASVWSREQVFNKERRRSSSADEVVETQLKSRKPGRFKPIDGDDFKKVDRLKDFKSACTKDDSGCKPSIAATNYKRNGTPKVSKLCKEQKSIPAAKTRSDSSITRRVSHTTSVDGRRSERPALQKPLHKKSLSEVKSASSQLHKPFSSTKLSKKPSTTKCEKKTTELEDRFEKLVDESTLKSEYIDLEQPIGSKDVRPVKLADKFTGRVSSSRLKAQRYAPFKTDNLKEIIHESKVKQNKSDTALLFGKPRKPAHRARDGQSPFNYAQPQVSSSDTDVVGKANLPSPEIPVVDGNVPKAIQMYCADNAPKAEACPNGQRLINYSLSDDWDMLSDENADEDDEEDVTMSFDLHSDVVMASMSQEEVSVDEPTSRSEHSAMAVTCDGQPRVCVVVDTCSMGNLQSLLKVKSIEFPRADSQVAGAVADHALFRIFIPWQVLQELDFLKDNKAGKFSVAKERKAMRVARLIHAELGKASSIVKLQSPLDDATDMKGFRIQTEDDHIIKCCLSLQNKFGSPHTAVVLMTEDINLINKCVACSLKASKYAELVTKWHSRPVDAVTHADSSANLQKMLKWLEKGPTTRAQSTNPPRAIVKPYNPPTPCKPAVRVQPPATPTTGRRGATAALTALERKTLDKVKEVANLTSLVAPHNLPTKTNEELREILSKLETLLKPVLSKCLSMEMSSVFGEIWLSVVYKKPPWLTLLPILESLHKHWMAVFGLVMSRHTVKAVKTLVDTYIGCNTTLDGVLGAIISATSLVRAIDKVGRSYSPEARAILPQLTALLNTCRSIDNTDDASKVAPSVNTDSTPSGGNINRVSTTTSQCSLACTDLTSIFTQLATACESVKGAAARDANVVVTGLGMTYNASMQLPLKLAEVSLFLRQLYAVAELLSIRVTLSLDDLVQFIASNRQLLLDGLAELENLAFSLKSRM